MKLPATVEAIDPHGGDVFSLRLRPQRPVPSFRPGQFLHLALDAYDGASHWPESRVFSIANSPTRGGALRVTFAVKGPFTRRMAQQLHAGDTVWVKLPYGDFMLAATATEVVLVAGGTGITPFVAFLEFWLDRPASMPIRLFYGARSEDLLLYRELIAECVAGLPDFRVRYFVEQSERQDLTRGRLSVEAVMHEVEHSSEADYYLSGPPAMIQVFADGLTEQGVPKPKIHMDAWA